MAAPDLSELKCYGIEKGQVWQRVRFAADPPPTGYTTEAIGDRFRVQEVVPHVIHTSRWIAHVRAVRVDGPFEGDCVQMGARYMSEHFGLEVPE